MKPTLALLLRFLTQHRESWFALTREIWEHPEIAFQERRAAALQVRLLKDRGFSVLTDYCNLDTAYRAEWGTGELGVAFTAEYDALPDLGHGCGHNLVAGAAVAGACALVELLRQRQVPGRVVVLGTPAEESGGGKLLMAARGGVRGVDAVMLAHPANRSGGDNGSLAMLPLQVKFSGAAAHAAAAPEKGRNALDAVMLLFTGINAWRQQLPESARVHGIVTDGGVNANVIPERSAARIYLRADDETLPRMRERFARMVQGAALMAACESELLDLGEVYPARRPNRVMNGYFEAVLRELGEDVPEERPAGRGSSDFGIFTQMCPAFHGYFRIAGEGTALHTPEMRVAAGSVDAQLPMLRAAAAMAQTGFDFLTDPHFRATVTVAHSA